MSDTDDDLYMEMESRNEYHHLLCVTIPVTTYSGASSN